MEGMDNFVRSRGRRISGSHLTQLFWILCGERGGFQTRGSCFKACVKCVLYGDMAGQRLA